MLLMTAKNTARCCLYKVDGWFKRVFKEQAGGAELIATLIIIGIVLMATPIVYSIIRRKRERRLT